MDAFQPGGESPCSYGTLMYNEAMPTSLLTTKLYIPPPRPNLVPRPRLIERLNAGLHGKLTLISAPAGFGKTTLLSEWVASCKCPVAWLSLDEGDNDPARFWAYFVAALQTIAPHLGEGILRALQSPQPPPAESILTALINEITAIPDNFLLVLDDYHVIDAKLIDDALTFLLDHLPPQMHLVIATREEPSLPLARLRVRGQLTELHSANLCFTPEETAVFLNSLMDLTLTPQDVAALERRTEGWVAGLQLAALSLSQYDASKRTRFIQHFTASNRHLMDYLVEEVLRQQSTHTTQFLTRTAILRRFNASLCDTVVGESNPINLIELERANLFLISLDETGEWFRYHHLFADLLHRQLQKTEPTILPSLHIRAADWFAEAGHLDDAIYHALQAPDYDRATTFLSEHIENMIIRGDIHTALHHINQRPPAYRDKDLRLTLYHAWTLLFVGQFEECARMLEQLSVLPNPRGWPVTAYETVLKGYLTIRQSRFSDNLRQGIFLLEQALDQLAQLPNPDTTTLIIQGAAAVELAFSYTFENEIKKAIILAQAAVRLNVKAGNVLAELASRSMLAQLTCAQGRWRQAATILQQGLKRAEAWTEALPWSVSKPPAVAPLLLNMGLIHYQWNDLDKATPFIEEADDLYALAGAIDRADGLLGLAQLRWAQGNGPAVAEIVESMQQLAQQSPFAYVRQRLDAAVVEWQIRLVQMGSEWAHLQAEILVWVQSCGLQADAPLNFRSEPQYVTLVRAWRLLDQAEAALALLRRLQTFAAETDRPGDVWRYQLLEVVVRMRLRETAVARHLLQETMTHTEPEGIIRLYVDEGQPIATLLQQLPPTPYRDRLLAAFDLQAFDPAQNNSPLSTPQSSLIEPLSTRELEVLQLLATGATNQQIADELVIAYATAKKHVSNILGKLGARNRVTAVARARELGLIG